MVKPKSLKNQRDKTTTDILKVLSLLSENDEDLFNGLKHLKKRVDWLTKLVMKKSKLDLEMWGGLQNVLKEAEKKKKMKPEHHGYLGGLFYSANAIIRKVGRKK